MSYKDVKKRFGLAIKNWRAQSGISQEELAWRADLHRTYIADIERGARNVSLQSIEKLAGALQVSLSTLFTPLSDTSEAGKAGVASEYYESVDILMIEDNPRHAAITLEAFRKAHLKNRIHVVTHGASAIEYLFNGPPAATRRQAQTRPQLILLDLSLPKSGAMQLLRRIKGDERTRQIPVVVLAAASDSAKIQESRRLGADMHIAKPLEFRRFFEATLRLNWHWRLFKAQDAISKSHAK